MMMWQKRVLGLLICTLLAGFCVGADKPVLPVPGFRTNTSKCIINLDELVDGGPGKDGIAAIDTPSFVKPIVAQRWLDPNEPVISLVIDDQARAYPLQILIWHEIVNDKVGDVPVAVSFCPLCYSAIVFDRRVEGAEHSFGVSGMLRHSDMVMYDRETENLWQQMSGKAIVGDLAGAQLKRMSAQIISFAQFRAGYADGLVLSRKTGGRHPYGINPYAGYEDIASTPADYQYVPGKKPRPRQKLVTVSIGNSDKAYPYVLTRRLGAINDQIEGLPIVVFHSGGAVSALDREQIALSHEVGSTGVFDRRVDGRLLTFQYREGRFIDHQTQSTWAITGQATAGPLKGRKLTAIPHGDYFAFAWLVFKPQTELYVPDSNNTDTLRTGP